MNCEWAGRGAPKRWLSGLVSAFASLALSVSLCCASARETAATEPARFVERAEEGSGILEVF